MKNIRILLTGYFLVLFIPLAPAVAQGDTFVLSGETLTVGTGTSMDRVVIYPNATLILDGGSITSSPAMDSVEVSAGGKCIMLDGYTDYFLNSGRLEMYGGSTSLSSSENHGYMKLAGGDPGIQIVLFDGVVDIFYPAATRTNLEISASTANPAPAVRIHTLTNSLGYGLFEIGDLGTPSLTYPGGAEYDIDGTYWSPDGDIDMTLTLNVPSNWNGKVLSDRMEVPASTSIVCTIDSAVALTWASFSNRGYQVQSTTNLLSGTWQDLGLPVYDTTGTNLFFDQANEGLKANRAKVIH